MSVGAKSVDLSRQVLATVGGASLALLVLVTSVDVIGRYAFNAPLASAYSLARLLMALMVFSALPLASAADEHLRAGLFEGQWSPSARRRRDMIIHALSAFACAALAWRLGAQAREYALNGELLEVIGLRLSWVAAVLSVLAAVSALACLVPLARALGTPAASAERSAG